MFTNPEQFANATKTLFELQMETFNALASKAVQGVEQVVALNMTTAKNSMEGAMAASRQMSQASDPKSAMDTLQAGCSRACRARRPMARNCARSCPTSRTTSSRPPIPIWWKRRTPCRR
jgi:hypothetical protein